MWRTVIECWVQLFLSYSGFNIEWFGMRLRYWVYVSNVLDFDFYNYKYSLTVSIRVPSPYQCPFKCPEARHRTAVRISAFWHRPLRYEAGVLVFCLFIIIFPNYLCGVRFSVEICREKISNDRPIWYIVSYVILPRPWLPWLWPNFKSTKVFFFFL